METFRFELKRAAVDRSYGVSTALFLVPIAILVALLGFVMTASSDLGPTGLLFLVPLALLVAIVVFQCFQWGTARAIEWPLWVDDRGLVFFTGRGRVELPWEAVTGVGFGTVLWTQQLTVGVHPQAGPGSAGVVSTVPPRTWRVIRRSGLRLSLRLLEAPPAEVAAVIARHSRRRWVPVPVA